MVSKCQKYTRTPCIVIVMCNTTSSLVLCYICACVHCVLVVLVYFLSVLSFAHVRIKEGVRCVRQQTAVRDKRVVL